MKLLLTGAGGMLARALVKAAHAHGHELTALDKSALDVTDAAAVDRTLATHLPDAVLQCAAYTRVDDAETDAQNAFAINVGGAGNVARSAARIGAWFVYPSTDYVFDGTASRPYQPDDETAPLNVYGASKLAGEREARSVSNHLVVRTSWLYGAGGRNFVATILQRARDGTALRVVDDQHGSPTWSADLARTILLLLERNAQSGVYHACNQGVVSWCEVARAAVELSGLTVPITAVKSSEFSSIARRPQYSALNCSTTEGVTGALRSWRVALAEALAVGV